MTTPLAAIAAVGTANAGATPATLAVAASQCAYNARHVGHHPTP